MTRPFVLCLGMLASVVLAWVGFAQAPEATADEKLLQAAGIATDDKGLLEFFRKRSLTEAEQAKLATLVHQLDEGKFAERESAAKRLVEYGKLAAPFLKKAMADGSLEFQMRADKCLKAIDAAGGADLPAAASRMLARGKPVGAAEVLLNYLPFADDEWLEDQIVAALADLTLAPGHVDPVIQAGLKDHSPARRGFAAYLVGKRGDQDQRVLARSLLTDADASVRQRVRTGLLGTHWLVAADENQFSDQALLSQAKTGTDPASLLAFLKARTLSVEQQNTLRQLVQQLGEELFVKRERATKKLLDQGPPAVPFLREALEDPMPEIARRARLILEQINQGPGPALPLAAVRLLRTTALDKSALKPADAIAALLFYLPFADDDAVYDEAVASLCWLSLSHEKIDPLFLAALEDPLPARAAAAFVLARVGSKVEVMAARRLLDDVAPRVRFHAALGLLAARERRAVTALLGLYGASPDPWAYRIEEVMLRLAGDQYPAGLTTDQSRAEQARAWLTWWRDQDDKIDLARLTLDEQRLGLTLIVQFDNNPGDGRGQVFECGRDGKPRWSVTGLNGPMDAQVLPGGRVLVAEHNAQRVSERELNGGKILWEFSTANPQGGNVVACQRLPGGNTFIATYNQLMEITPAKKEVYRINRGPASYIFGAQRTRQGKIVYVTAQGLLHVFDPVSGKEDVSLNLGQPGGWAGVEALPNGRFLVALMSQNQVREIDAKGAVLWQADFPGVFRASRLPNGHTMVVSMTTRQVAELDRSGKRVWEKTLTGRPWMARTR